jgi:threonylcarbamoyladenosine tRNA methylthiotransferase MtaB
MEGSPQVLGNNQKMAIPGILSGEDVPEEPAQEKLEDLLITRFDGRGRAILKIQDGCNLRCSFCIVPLARGNSRSRSSRECLSRVHALQENGFHEVVLSGIQLGLYRDPDSKGGRLPELLSMLLDKTRDVRFRLGSMLPKHVSSELLDLFQSEPERLCPHFHVSLQSGDDGILRSMKRPYTSAEYRETLERICSAVSNVCVGTDVITGYPGESGNSFMTTLTFLQSLPLHYAHVFPYSPRPGTVASTLEGKVDRSLAMRRGAILRDMFRDKEDEYRKTQTGKTLQVLAETPLPGGMMRGRSENYLKVTFSAEGVHAGEIRSMKVSGLESDGLTATRIVGESGQ